MKRKKVFRSDERGAVLVVTLLVSVALLILTAPFLFKLSSQYRSTDRSFKSFAALNLAEAGVEMAIWELNSGDITTWKVPKAKRTKTLSSVTDANGNIVGDIDMTVYDADEANPVVEVTGKVPLTDSETVERTLRVELYIDTEVLFELALFAENGITIGGKSKVDGYDSREGEYKGQNKGFDATIGTNAIHYGAITLLDKAELTGNASIGSDGDTENILVLDKAKILGRKQTLGQPSEIPPIYAPQGLPWRGEITEDDGPVINITENGEYSSINLNKSVALNISDDVTVYIAGPFIMQKGSKFLIEDGVHVQLYLGHSFYMENGSKFNKKLDVPTNLQIWGTNTFTGEFIAEGEEGGGFILDAKNTFCGAVYVPNGTVEINGNMKFFGSIVAESIVIDANAQVHYDMALAEINTPYSGDMFKVKSWQEIRLPLP